MLKKIPQPVKKIIEKLNEANFEAFIVGGCVRDLLLKKEPQDWDVATNAQPEEVQRIFSESFYENDFGTVGIKVPRFSSAEKTTDEKEIVEVTTYRIESKYSDRRHPDQVRFAKTLEEDLSRRDFTINALAIKLIN